MNGGLRRPGVLRSDAGFLALRSRNCQAWIFGKRNRFRNVLGKFGTYLQETKQELKKVTWPSRGEVVQATGVVILTTFIMGCLIGVADILLAWVVKLILG